MSVMSSTKYDYSKFLSASISASRLPSRLPTDQAHADFLTVSLVDFLDLFGRLSTQFSHTSRERGSRGQGRSTRVCIPGVPSLACCSMYLTLFLPS